jgi:hypothetical protein
MSEKQTKKKLKVNVDGLVNEMPKVIDEPVKIEIAEPVALVKPKRVATGATIEALAKGRAKLQDSWVEKRRVKEELQEKCVMKKMALKERQKQELYKAYGLESDDDVDDVDDDYKKSDERDRIAYAEQCKQIALKKEILKKQKLEPKKEVAPLPKQKKEKKIKYVEQSESESEEEIIYVKKAKPKYQEALPVLPKIMFC